MRSAGLAEPGAKRKVRRGSEAGAFAPGVAPFAFRNDGKRGRAA
jgi:hypothetical protein